MAIYTPGLVDIKNMDLKEHFLLRLVAIEAAIKEVEHSHRIRAARDCY